MVTSHLNPSNSRKMGNHLYSMMIKIFFKIRINQTIKSIFYLNHIRGRTLQRSPAVLLSSRILFSSNKMSFAFRIGDPLKLGLSVSYKMVSQSQGILVNRFIDSPIIYRSYWFLLFLFIFFWIPARYWVES